MALGFEEKAFLYDALVFLKRTFDPIHMIAVSIWHPTNDLVIARSRVTKKHIRNAGSRIVISAHYPGDVKVGAFVGVSARFRRNRSPNGAREYTESGG
jgi:hypothetical protein